MGIVGGRAISFTVYAIYTSASRVNCAKRLVMRLGFFELAEREADGDAELWADIL